jgi:hypothetical protein
MFFLISSLFFSSGKSENRRAEQILFRGGGSGTGGRGKVAGNWIG